MKEEINAAIIAHGEWKERLASAIETGKSEFTPDKIMVDNLCVFGKWFHSLTGADTVTEEYSEVKELHATFHKAAAKVLDAALAGKTEEARALIGDGSEYAKISSSLTLALGRWRNKVV